MRASLRFTGNIVLFLLVLAFLNLLAQKAFWPCLLPVDVRDKLAILREYKDEVDLVFVGSSLVQNQVNTEVFDAELARRGCDVRSFNHGHLGLSVLESEALIGRIHSLGCKRLKWVMIEPFWPYSDAISAYESMSERAVWWHSPRATWDACVFEWSGGGSLLARTAKTISHLQHASVKGLHIGRGFDIIRYLSEQTTTDGRHADLRSLGKGYVPFSLMPDLPDRVRRGPEEHRLRMVKYENAMRAWTPSMLRPCTEEFFRAQEGRLWRLGLAPLYLAAAPHLEDPGEMRQLEANGSVSILFDYTDPSKYPQLYERDAFYDTHHLTDEKSEEFTRLLANDFADYLEGKR